MRAADRWYRRGRTQYIDVRPLVAAGVDVELHLAPTDGIGRFTVLLSAQEARAMAAGLLRSADAADKLAAERRGLHD